LPYKTWTEQDREIWDHTETGRQGLWGEREESSGKKERQDRGSGEL